jgi:Fe-S-cluster containining protein
MVGAKEFAINRKVIAPKDKNPLIEGISMPSSMRSHESDIKNIAGSFLDKFKHNSFSLPKMIEHKEIMVKRFPKMDKPYDARSINPILEDSKSKKTIASKKPRQIDNNMFNISPVFDFMRSNMEGENKHEEHEECNDLSDELANHITYKVFQNIKNYLDRDLDKPMGNRQIKLEISL